MKQSKKAFYPKGTVNGKRTILFNLQVVNGKEYKGMTLSQKILAIAFLEDCKTIIQEWINELKQ